MLTMLQIYKTYPPPPLALSSQALMALQRLEFRMPGPKVVRLEDWRSQSLSPIGGGFRAP